jgi:hypothetical protein
VTIFDVEVNNLAPHGGKGARHEPERTYCTILGDFHNDLPYPIRNTLVADHTHLNNSNCETEMKFSGSRVHGRVVL